MKKTVIFDFDGTIADSIPDDKTILKIFNKIADEHNFKNITLQKITELRDIGLWDSIKLLKIPLFKLPFIAKRAREIVKADESIAKPIKNMPMILKNLKNEGYCLGIMTSNNTESVKEFLDKHHLKVFDFIHTGKNLFGKDRILKNLLNKYKLSNSSVIYVGDEIRDIQATKKINMPIIAVTWGYNSKKGLLKYLPDYIIDTPLELPKILALFFKK